jgi:site-specific DNA-methyltransferase (adenine-specific)
MNQTILGNCFEVLATIPDHSIDTVITDPPYKYLKHKLESDWDEWLFFNECYRIIKKNGFLVFFGRGEAWFRWNYFAQQLDFKFKEEIIWDKVRTSNPMCSLPRSHENIAIYTKGKGTLRDVRIDKIEFDLLHNPTAVINDFKRILSSLKSIKTWDDFLLFREGKLNPSADIVRNSITIRGGKYSYDRGSQTAKAHLYGRKFPSIFRCFTDYYNYEHPTQKPLELMKRLVELVTPENALILDPFAGSGTTALACLETNREYIVIEREPEYYEVIQKRITQWHNDRLNATGTHELPDGVERIKEDKNGQLSLF